MATKKISELEEINQAENDDYLVVVDTSESKNKKITKENFLKISALEEKISDLENNQLTASTEGTSIDINDSADYQVREMIPNGNVVQNSTTGKNLFNMDGNPIVDRLSSAGYTLKYNDDKTITINGTGTGAYKYLTWNLTLEAGTYIANGCPSGGSQNGYSFLIDVGSSSYWDYGNGVSFTLTAKTTIQLHPIRTGSDIPTFNNVTFKPMIRLSSITDASYEPYTGGIASPNPQYEQPINSAGDNINLFDKTANITRGYTYTSTGETTQLNNCFVQEKYIEVESSKEYILSTTNSYISETDYRLVICEYDSSKNFIKRNLSSTQYYKITTSATTKYVRLCASTVTIDELKFEHGSIATPYSPYGMGSINEVISNKNLFKIPITTINGITCTQLEDGAYCFNGTATADSFFKFALTKEIANGTNHVLSCTSNQTSSKVHIRTRNSSNGLADTMVMNVTSSSVTSTKQCSYSEITIQRGAELSDFIVYPQLELGLSSTSFVQHQEQNISIPCQQPMRSIGNVRDSFVKIDEVWYEKHNIGQVVLNGSRDWVKSSTYSNEKYFCGYLAYGISNSIVGSFTINDRFQIGYYVNVLDEECMSSMPQLHVRILASRLIENSVNAFKTWLSTHNTEVIYQLAEPIYLECTEEQIIALEQARTYKPVTHILSADVVPAYLGVTYVRDLETVINNLS